MANIFDLFKKIEKKEVAPMPPVSFMIVGLGNPGMKYENTRHNTGFMAIDVLAKEYQVKIDKLKFHSLVGDGMIGAYHVLFVKPQTLMNASGIAVKEASDFYKIPVEKILVLSDDISLAVGRMRLRLKGSAGGHNGLKDIIKFLGSENFMRLRIGVGEKPNPEYDLVDWVLGQFSSDDRKLLFSCFPCVKETINLVLEGKFDNAIMVCNSCHSEPSNPQNKENK